MTSFTVDAVRTRYELFANRECKGYSELYYTLALAVASDAEVLRFISAMPVIQPNLFFAALQFLTGPEAMPSSGPDLSAFVVKHEDEIAELMRTRSTQTNEVGRCGVLLPALPSGAPVALLEVGASAGLCLLMDHYFYDYGSKSVGDAKASVRLKCSLTGSTPVPSSLPDVVWRGGLDLSPIDVHNEDSVRWLLSCVWADHGERRERLAAAIDTRRRVNFNTHQGDLADDLAPLIEEVPSDATLVVFHSAVLNYVSEEHRMRFAAELAGASRDRPIIWISNEGPGIVSRMVRFTPPMTELRFVLGETVFADGVGTDRLLGLSHPHGATLEWLAG